MSFQSDEDRCSVHCVILCFVLQYGDIMPNDSIFACKTKVSGGQEQEQVLVPMKFTDQVSNFVELKLLWNR